MTYTSEQNLEIAQARIRLRRTGHPSTVQRIDLAVSENKPFSKVQALYRVSEVKPEKKMEEVIYVPPNTTGKGSGVTNWRSFAKKVSDMDPEIIDSMEKSDIITVLRDKGVIQ
jgi:hypothetical protein